MSANETQAVTETGATAIEGDTSTGPRTGLTRLLVFLFPATTAMYALFQSIQQVLLPAQVESIAPEAKVATLALLTTLSAVASMVALPIGGAISDRTRSRFGKRTPWILLSAAASALLMTGMGLTSSLVVLAVLYMLLWFSANFYSGAVSAILPDRVAVRHRGIASAVVGLATPVGIIIGVNVASRVDQFWGYTIVAVFLVVATMALVIGAREPSSLDLPRLQRERRSAGQAVAEVFQAFKHRDFSLAFGSRFGLFMAYFTVSGFLYYTVQDYIGTENLPGGSVPLAVSTLSTVSLVAWVAVATPMGWLADRINRRKLFVAISAVGVGLCQIIPIVSPSWTGMLVYSALNGAFIGVYFAVDLALMSLVLPSKENQGRDFAFLAVATGLPQVLSSIVAAGLITWFGGYSALFTFSAVCAAVAGIMAIRIRSVR
jgi:MFS family permease